MHWCGIGWASDSTTLAQSTDPPGVLDADDLYTVHSLRSVDCAPSPFRTTKSRRMVPAGKVTSLMVAGGRSPFCYISGSWRVPRLRRRATAYRTGAKRIFGED
jgi:hypothetical protein